MAESFITRATRNRRSGTYSLLSATRRIRPDRRRPMTEAEQREAWVRKDRWERGAFFTEGNSNA
jgi:hypothetical protein